MIFSDLNAGWCRFELDGFSAMCSYVKYVPLDVLKGVLDYLKYGRCVISFDEEGSYFYLIADDYVGDVFVVSYDFDNEKRKTKTINKTPDAVVAALYDDIAANIDEWVDWQSDTMRDGDYVRKSLNKLIKEIDDARNHTKKNKAYEERVNDKYK